VWWLGYSSLGESMLAVGDIVGGYTVLDRIGEGSSGDVYAAEEPRTATLVAVKILGRELSKKPKVLDRFLKEARAASHVRHPGIAKTLDSFIHDGYAFVVTELLEGEDLKVYLERVGNLSNDLPFLIGMGVALTDAIGTVHETGIIHRDLKPRSIFLHLDSAGSADVAPKVLDFGAIRLSEEEDSPGHTASGLLAGTPAYMSPEQCRGDTGIDSRSDVYSLGCILYEAACGRPPFLAEGLGDLLVAHVSRVPEQPSKIAPGLSPLLSTVITRLLAKKPEDRPQSMGEVARALRECARAARVELERKPLRPKTPVELSKRSSPRARREESLTRQPLPEPAASEQPGFPVSPIPQTLEVPRVRGSVTTAVMPPPAERESIPDPSKTIVDPPQSPNRMGTSVMPEAPLVLPKAPIVGDAGGTMAYDPPSAPSRNRPSEEGSKDAAHAPRPKKRAGAPDSFFRKISLSGLIRQRIVLLAATGVVVLVFFLAYILTRPAPPLSEAPETVEIELHGLPSGTEVVVDDQPTRSPIRVPRGPALHRIVLRSPGSPERTIEIDGTKDRIVEMLGQN